ncbi:MAG: PAS domain S-box protein [Desulfuromonadaceae bacterium]|nr:PAS domain S-box protein [Desulfuromonadaceae bacterium]MDD2854822.1 PAS domain S-box protein [Desulfuromonadaceae bacterium]
MTLYQRTILIIVSTFIALLFILAVSSDMILLSSFSSLEKAQVVSHTQNISNQLEDKLTYLEITAEELVGSFESGSDATASLFADWYVRSNNLDFVALYDNAGGLVSINSLGNILPVRQNALNAILSMVTAQKDAVQGGAVNIGGSPAMLVFRHIKGNGRVNGGLLVVGWFIDNLEIERLFRAAGSKISLYDLNETLPPDVKKAAAEITSRKNIYSSAIDSSYAAGYLLLKDIFGQPSYIVRTIEKRTLYEYGKVTIAYIIVALILAAVALCSVMLIFIRSTILNRLQTLTSKVSRIRELRDISTRIPLSEYNDELSTVAISINGMLDSLEKTESVLRESEERYRMLFDRAPDAIIIIGMDGDEAGRVIAANQAAAEQHGYTLDELLKLHIYDLNTPDTNLIAADIFTDIGKGNWVTAELWHQKKDGSRFPIEIHAGLIRIDGKNYVLGFDRDITARKITEETKNMHLQQINQLNDELNQKASDLSAANSELETFNYSISHDMRGPLTRISGYCQLLLEPDSALDDSSREYVKRIYESETWLNQMIDALMQLAQLNREQILSAPVNLSLIVDEALKELAAEHPDRFVKTEVMPDIIVAGDDRLLKMAVVNLLNNAWKYSSGKSDAFIEFGVDNSGCAPVYYVRDNGAGFDMKETTRLFRVFSRLDNSDQFPGTGIGLATVHRIISRHGGRIWAEGEPDVGATFYFTLQ